MARKFVALGVVPAKLTLMTWGPIEGTGSPITSDSDKEPICDPLMALSVTGGLKKS